MAKRKAVVAPPATAKQPAGSVEPMVIALAEQLGTFLGRVQAKADGWLENESLREQVTRIRDGATAVLAQVNGAGARARKLVTRAKPAAPTRKKKAKTARPRPGGVDAPGKRHRKPPPQLKVDRHASAPAIQPIIHRPMPNRRRTGVR